MNRKRRSYLEQLETRQLLAVDTASITGLSFESPDVFTPNGVGNNGLAATAYADLNGDGHSDLIYALASDSDVSVALSQGNGRFADQPIDFSLPQTISSITVAELNADNVADLLVTADKNVYTMLGHAEDGTWIGFERVDTIRTGSNSVDVGDVDLDGQVDLVLTSDRTTVYRGTGNGAFADPIQYGKSRTGRHSKLSDVDQDGDLDLVNTHAQGITVLRNDAGIFETELDSIAQANNGSFAIGDVSGDQVPDLLLSLGNREHAFVGVSLGNSDGTFDNNIRKYETLGTPVDIKLGDVNGDFRMDIIVGHDGTFHHHVNGNGPGGVSILLANETGSFEDAIRISTPNASHVFTDDTNGDGQLDIVATHRQVVRTYRQQPQHAIGELTKFDVGRFSGAQFAAGDLNDDSYTDIAIATFDWTKEVGELELMLGTPDGSYTSKVLSLSMRANSLHIANFDSDDDNELALHLTDFQQNEYVVIDLDANDEFQQSIVSRPKDSLNVRTTIDVNRDGIMDLLGVGTGTSILMGSPTGEFSWNHVSDHSGYGVPPTVDFNNDGNADLLIEQGGKGFEVLVGDGTGEFRQSHSEAFEFPSIGVGDFNGDGNQDVAFTSFRSNSMNIIYGIGDGTFTKPERHPHVRNSTFHVEDFNHDGRSDFLFDSYEKFEIHLRTDNTFESIGDSIPLVHSVGDLTAIDTDGDGQREFVLTPGLSISAAQAQFTTLDNVGFDKPSDLRTITFATTLMSDVTPIDFDNDGSMDLMALSIDGAIAAKVTPALPDGDQNLDGQTNIDDVDFLCHALHSSNEPLDLRLHDLDRDGAVDLADVEFLVEKILKTHIGDVNGNGVFDSSDFVQIFSVAKYEDGIDNNTLWSEGDWNCDGDFTTKDLVYAFQRSSYSVAATPANRLLMDPRVLAGALVDHVFFHKDAEKDRFRNVTF